MKLLPVATAAACLASAFAANMAHADPVQFDTDDAHVVVIRPIDTWSPSEQGTEFVLDRYKLKQIRYWFYDENGKKTFGENAIDTNPTAHEVADLAKPLGFEVGGWRGAITTIEQPVTLDAQEMQAFSKAQDQVFKSIVMKGGNPAELTSKTRHQKWLASAFSLAVGAVGVKALGGVGLQAAQGPMEDVYKLTMQAKQVLAPQPAVPFDYAGYKTVEIRRVKLDARLGQIIIAYRGDKTPEAEQHALAKAIVSVSGADTTLEDIQASQAKDLANRQTLWDACVAAKECTADE